MDPWKFRGIEATSVHEKLTHKSRAVKLAVACIVLAEWRGVGGVRLGGRREQNLPTSAYREDVTREWLGM